MAVIQIQIVLKRIIHKEYLDVNNHNQERITFNSGFKDWVDIDYCKYWLKCTLILVDLYFSIIEVGLRHSTSALP